MGGCLVGVWSVRVRGTHVCDRFSFRPAELRPLVVLFVVLPPRLAQNSPVPVFESTCRQGKHGNAQRTQVTNIGVNDVQLVTATTLADAVTTPEATCD